MAVDIRRSTPRPESISAHDPEKRAIDLINRLVEVKVRENGSDHQTRIIDALQQAGYFDQIGTSVEKVSEVVTQKVFDRDK